MRIRAAILISATLLAAPALAADFAPVGAKAVLSVDYLYESAGRKADKYDSHEWKVLRSVSMSVDLAAGKPASLSQVQAPDAAQSAKIDKQRAQAEKMSAQMAPTMASVEKIMAKCGEDEACIERESMKLGFGMSGSQQTEQQLKTGRETTKLMAKDADRYQIWKATALKGSYQIEESAKFVDADPLCMTLPGARCHRSETRSGAGAVPGALLDAVRQGNAAGFATVEIDTGKNMMWARLPLPLNLLPISETIVTDKPGNNEPKGPQKRQYDFKALRDIQPFNIALKGGWRNQSGEQAIDLKGGAGETGKLRVRWRFVAQ